VPGAPTCDITATEEELRRLAEEEAAARAEEERRAKEAARRLAEAEAERQRKAAEALAALHAQSEPPCSDAATHALTRASYPVFLLQASVPGAGTGWTDRGGG
jgi:membrane protein involved in colicin uptake